MVSLPATTIAPLLLKNLFATMFMLANKSFLNLADNYKLLEFIRCLVVSPIIFFFLRFLPFFFHFFNNSNNYSGDNTPNINYDYSKNGGPPHKAHNCQPSVGGRCDCGISRALSQLLSILTDIPVSSRKYEMVRSLAEKVIDENLLEGSQTLRDVNSMVLSAAFSRTLAQLEAAVLDGGGGTIDDSVDGPRAPADYYGLKLNRVFGAVRYCGDMVWRLGSKAEVRRSGVGTGWSAEKLAAEMLWLAQKLTACGDAEEAVWRWASASNLAGLALSVEPRLQGSFVRVSAFLFKQAKDIGSEEDDEESKGEQRRRVKMKMLMSWLPLLCRGSSGTDAPVLSMSEKAELERVLEELIEALEQEEEQGKVLSLWLHHFTHCPSSDWPNLHSCYARWYTASRNLFLLQRH